MNNTEAIKNGLKRELIVYLKNKAKVFNEAMDSDSTPSEIFVLIQAERIVIDSLIKEIDELK